MLSAVANSTIEYINCNPKKERKNKGQFFTCKSTAMFMSGLFDVEKEEVNLLDPGAGTGILSVALVERLITKNSIKTINLDLFENDKIVLPLLASNMEKLKEKVALSKKEFNFKIYSDNFISYHSFFWNSSNMGYYDAIISNPPYSKIGKNSPEAVAMKSIVYGQPNMYFLFMAMAAKLLCQNGELVFIVPRSFVSGLYFLKFREYFLKEVKIKNIHLFIRRDKVFNTENILQETLIIKAKKSLSTPDSIQISTSDTTSEFNYLRVFDVPYSVCIDYKSDCFIRLPSSNEDTAILNKVGSLRNNLNSLGYKAKTGLVVDFRSSEYLRNKPDTDTVPLIWASNFQNGNVVFCNSKIENQYITIEKRSLLMPQGNYLLLKRFSTKEEQRRLQPAMYFSKSEETNYISTENHLNFVVKKDGSCLSKQETWGLFAIFNSTLWDKYFRILNGSTQVNSNELNSIPLPDIQDILSIGSAAEMAGAFLPSHCDELIKEYIRW